MTDSAIRTLAVIDLATDALLAQAARAILLSEVITSLHERLGLAAPAEWRITNLDEPMARFNDAARLRIAQHITAFRACLAGLGMTPSRKDSPCRKP